MWDLMDHHLISIKIIEDLFDGVESDLNKKVQLNNKKDLSFQIKIKSTLNKPVKNGDTVRIFMYEFEFLD